MDERLWSDPNKDEKPDYSAAWIVILCILISAALVLLEIADWCCCAG